MQVEIWSDIVCPWCYLGKRRFEQALTAFPHRDHVDVVYRSFELDPSAARDVTTPTIELLAGRYGMTVHQAEDAQQQMEQRAAQDGLTFHMDGLRSGNTRDAHRLVQLAGQRERQAELVERLHRAYFTEQASVFEHASLTELAVDVGLDRDEVTAVLAGEAYDDAVDADEAMARSLGATGVPFFVIDRQYGISGAQPAQTIAEVLDRAWADSEATAR
jgi:predicted DsbA family dithiol-disulfide isomerase